MRAERSGKQQLLNEKSKTPLVLLFFIYVTIYCCTNGSEIPYLFPYPNQNGVQIEPATLSFSTTRNYIYIYFLKGVCI